MEVSKAVSSAPSALTGPQEEFEKSSKKEAAEARTSPEEFSASPYEPKELGKESASDMSTKSQVSPVQCNNSELEGKESVTEMEINQVQELEEKSRFGTEQVLVFTPEDQAMQMDSEPVQ